MTPDQYQELAITLLAPVMTAVLGVLGVVFGDWRQRRTEAGRRKVALEDASRQVSFVAEWLKARKLVADSPEAEQEATTRAAAWLEEASALVAESRPPRDERPAITLQRLLLLSPLRRRAARVLRAAFHVCLGLMPIWVGLVMHNILDPQREYIPADMAISVALVLLAMGFRLWARRVEKARPEGQQRRRVTLRRALLLYRLDRPAARIVRIIFYSWTLLLAAWAVGTFNIDRTEPRYIPGDVFLLVGFAGYAVVLRYWASSLEARRKERGDSHAAADPATGWPGRGGGGLRA